MKIKLQLTQLLLIVKPMGHQNVNIQKEITGTDKIAEVIY